MTDDEREQLKEQLKLQRQRNKIEAETAKFSERAHKSAEEYFKTKKKISELAKVIRDLEQDIALAVGEEKVKLEEELKIRKGILAETKKELSLVKAIGNEIGTKVVGALSKQTQLLSKSSSMFYDIDESVRKTSMSLGLSAGRMATLSQNAQGVANHFASIGLSSTDAIAGQAAFSEEVGRTVMLSQEAMTNMGNLAQKAGMSTSEIGGMVGQMEAFGMGSVTAMKSIEEIRDTAQGMGINSGKVIKKVQQNMGLLNKLNFKGGVKGLGKMAAYSEKFKMDMSALADSAKAVWSPEGAIEAASSLQTLGGGFSKLADPFKLMFDARNDPEKYAESITESLTGIAKFKDGQFGVSAYEMQRLDEAGKALGFSGEQMKEMAIQKAKMDKIDGGLNMFSDPKDREMLAGMVDFDKNGKAIIDGKALSEMTDLEKQKLVDNEKQRELQAQDAISARQQWEGIKNQMISTFLPIMEGLDKILRPLLEGISGFIKESPILAASIAGIGMAVGKVAEWHIKGYNLGLGFNAATSGKGFFGSLGAKLKSMIPGMGGKGGASSPQSVIQEKVTQPTEKVTKGGGSGSSLKSLAEGLGAMGNAKVLFGALNLIPTSIGMIAMLPAIPTLLFLGNVKLKSLSSNLFEMALGLEFMAGGKVLAGAAILSVAAIGFTLMTAGILGLGAVALLGAAAGAGMVGLSTGLSAFGAIAGNPMVWLGVALLGALSLVFIGFSYGVKLIAEGIASVVTSFATLFEQIASGNIMNLLLLGPALIGISLGVMMLGVSLLMLAASMALGGWLGLMALGTAAESVGTAFKGIDANGITQSVDAINNVDMDKINALKELSTAMAVWGMFGSKPIEVHMSVDGEIKMGGANGQKFDINQLSPAQVSELKDLIFQKQKVDSKGGV